MHSVSALQCYQVIYQDKKAPYSLSLQEIQEGLNYELRRKQWKEFAKSIRVINDKTVLKVSQSYVDAFVKSKVTKVIEHETSYANTDELVQD